MPLRVGVGHAAEPVVFGDDAVVQREVARVGAALVAELQELPALALG